MSEKKSYTVGLLSLAEACFRPKQYEHITSRVQLLPKKQIWEAMTIKDQSGFCFFPMSPLQMICKILEHANLFPTLGLHSAQLTGTVTGEWHPSHRSCVVSVGLHSAKPGRIASHIYMHILFASSQT